jgi:hypothetical protein
MRKHDGMSELLNFSALPEPGQSHRPGAHNLSRFNHFMTMLKDSRGFHTDLLSLLRRVRLQETTDARDKIFALLNVASDGKSLPAADYSLDLTQVYYRYAESLADTRHSIQLLAMSFIDKRDPSWRSWVPKWDKPTPEFNFEFSTGFCAGGGMLYSPPWLRFNLGFSNGFYAGARTVSSSSCDGDKLRVKAVHVDDIETRSGSFKSDNILSEDLANFIDDFLNSRSRSSRL